MCPLIRPLNYDPSFAGKLANWAIRGDIVRALVELVTNSDDSYRRLEAKGVPGSGLIKVAINRKHQEAIIEVTDEAEGFDDEKMSDRVGTYAADTSGFTDGLSVRGIFGRGLKDAILGLGEGKVQSIIDGFYYECSLDSRNFKLEDPYKLKKARKNVIQKLWV